MHSIHFMYGYNNLHESKSGNIYKGKSVLLVCNYCKCGLYSLLIHSIYIIPAEMVINVVVSLLREESFPRLAVTVMW